VLLLVPRDPVRSANMSRLGRPKNEKPCHTDWSDLDHRGADIWRDDSVAHGERAVAGRLFHIQYRAGRSGRRNLGWDSDGSGTVAMKGGARGAC
jgi:hypothetical protein